MKKGLLSGHATWHDPKLQHGNSTIVGILFRLEKGITTVSCQTLPFHEVNAVLGLHVEHSLGLYQLEHLHKKSFVSNACYTALTALKVLCCSISWLTNFIPNALSSTLSTANSRWEGITQRGDSPLLLA